MGGPQSHVGDTQSKGGEVPQSQTGVVCSAGYPPSPVRTGLGYPQLGQERGNPTARTELPPPVRTATPPPPPHPTQETEQRSIPFGFTQEDFLFSNNSSFV